MKYDVCIKKEYLETMQKNSVTKRMAKVILNEKKQNIDL